MAVLAAAMAVACLPCAWHLWRGPSVGAARAVIAMSLAMVAVHGTLVVAGAGVHGDAQSGHAQGHHAAASAPVDPHAQTMLAIIAVELSTALLAAAWVRRQREAGAGVVRP